MRLVQFGLIPFLLWMGSAHAASKSCDGPIGGREGNCAADFQLQSLDGKPVRLSDFKGKVVFLNFWATWCEPCAVELPAIDRLGAYFKGKEIKVLTVSIDKEGKAAIEPFFAKVLKKHEASFDVLLDTDQKISKSYGTFKVPETYIIDPSGRIRDKAEGIRDWDDAMMIHYLELLSAK
jgi:cytochrome c biogenesis protein CcmG, thiol:disulfide interchange protein DsbE